MAKTSKEKAILILNGKIEDIVNNLIELNHQCSDCNRRTKPTLRDCETCPILDGIITRLKRQGGFERALKIIKNN